MKVKTNDMVYLEHFDVRNFLLVESTECPQSIRDELSEMGGADGFGVYGQFAYAFKRPENVRWLMRQKYILEYTKYVRYSTPKLKKILERAKSRYETKTKKYEKRDRSYKASCSGQVARQRSTRRYWYIISLEHLLYCRKNGILFCFAKDIRGEKQPQTSPQ